MIKTSGDLYAEILSDGSDRYTVLITKHSINPEFTLTNFNFRDSLSHCIQDYFYTRLSKYIIQIYHSAAWWKIEAIDIDRI
jgi:hypothetical protein